MVMFAHKYIQNQRFLPLMGVPGFLLFSHLNIYFIFPVDFQLIYTSKWKYLL